MNVPQSVFEDYDFSRSRHVLDDELIVDGGIGGAMKSCWTKSVHEHALASFPAEKDSVTTN